MTRFAGMFEATVWNRGRVRQRARARNSFTNEGIEEIMYRWFEMNGEVATTSTFFRLIDNAGFSALDYENDTLASHVGWTEFTTYVGTRTLSAIGLASGMIKRFEFVSGNHLIFPGIAYKAEFAGAFISTVSTGSGGKILSEALWDVPVKVRRGDRLEWSYTIHGDDL